MYQQGEAQGASAHTQDFNYGNQQQGGATDNQGSNMDGHVTDVDFEEVK